MSSKKFKSGLESLFDNAEREFEQDHFAIAEQRAAEAAATPARKPEKAAKRKGKGRLGKSFTSDLDSLFDLAVEERQQRPAAPRPKTVDKLRERKALSGLDALIRQTAEVGADGQPQRTTKRVTFAYNRQKLDKLKRIARNRRLYLKDIMTEIVNDYLARNENG